MNEERIRKILAFCRQYPQKPFRWGTFARDIGATEAEVQEAFLRYHRGIEKEAKTAEGVSS